jgi:type II secretory pathway component PulF
MTVSLWAIIALFVFILPAIFEIATQLDSDKIPWITLQLKAFSDLLINNRKTLIGLTIFWGFAWFTLLSTETGQKLLYNTLYNIPVIGKMIQSYYLVRFARYCKLLLWSGMNYRDVFKMLMNVINIPSFTPLFQNVINWLDRGQSIFDSIKYETMLIPSNVSALIKVGEKTASLSGTFDTIIDIYSEELDNYINNLSKVIEPFMLIIVWSVIVMIALGVFWVIMAIMDSVNI